MSASFVGIGFLEMIILLSGSGGGLMGLPPGERDAKLLRTPPADSVLYVEWAERSTGKEGAAGIDGLAADPEIRHFLARVDGAIQKNIDKEDPESPPAVIYPLARKLLMRPGCAFAAIDADALKTATEKSPLGTPMWAVAASSAVRAALIVNAGKEADEVDDAIRTLIAIATDDAKREDLKMRELPHTGGIPVFIHRHESYFILSLGKAAAEGAVAGLSGKSEGLTKHAGLAAALKQTSVERVGSVSWLDFAGLLEKVSEGLGTQGIIVKTMAATIGLDAIKSVTSTSGVTGGEMHQRMFIATNGKKEGILAVAAGRPLKESDFAHLPADSDLALVFSIDGKKIFEALKEIAGKADPGALKAVENAVEQLETDLGLSLEDDVFGALGNVWALHDSPDAGGVILTGGVLSIEVKDRAKAEKVAAKLLAILGQEVSRNEGGKPLEDHTFLDQTVTTVDFPRHGPPVQLSLCVTDKHVYVALQPQAIKAQLRFLKKKGPGFDAKTSKVIPIPAGDALSASYMDTRAAARILTTLLPYWGKTAVDQFRQQDIDFDQFDIPSAAAYLPYVTPSIASWTRMEDGLHAESRGGIPLPGGVGPLMGFFAGFAQARAVHQFRAIEGRAAPAAVPAAAPAVLRPVARPGVVIRVQAVPIQVEAPKVEKIEKPKKDMAP